MNQDLEEGLGVKTGQEKGHPPCSGSADFGRGSEVHGLAGEPRAPEGVGTRTHSLLGRVMLKTRVILPPRPAESIPSQSHPLYFCFSLKPPPPSHKAGPEGR